MIKELEISQLATVVASRRTEDRVVLKFEELRRIGSFIEHHEHSVHVVMNDMACEAFRSRSIRHIKISKGELILEGIKSPVFQALIRQYAPKGQLAELIEKAIR